jgi:hypothetical protein
MSNNPIIYIEVNCSHKLGADYHFATIWVHRNSGKLMNYTVSYSWPPDRQARRIVRGIHILTAFVRRSLEKQMEAHQ